MIGEKVQDATAAEPDNKKYYGTVALSNFAKIGDFHITDGGTTVLAVITRVSAAAYSEKHAADLHIEIMQRIQEDVVPKAVYMIQQMQSIAAMRASDPSTSNLVCEKLAKSRKLGRWPTESTE